MGALRPTPVLRWLVGSADAERIIPLSAAFDPVRQTLADMSPTSAATLQLLHRYRASLPQKHAELSEKWQRLLLDPADALALTSIQQAVHRLAGSAGAYGCTALGDFARDADALILLRNHPITGDESHAVFLSRLAGAVQRVLDQLAAEF